jgi:hypothetical protein
VEWVLEDGSKVVGNCQESRTINDAFTNAVGSRKMKSLQSRPSKTTCTSPDFDLKPHDEGPKGCPWDYAATVGPASKATNHFYLHRPNLPSRVRCLIPIPSDASVRDVVRGRVLIEFPTIFVLSVSKEKLQKPFITEEDYINEHRNEPPKVGPETWQRPFKASDHGEELGGLKSPLQLDEKRIAEVLQKDLEK